MTPAVALFAPMLLLLPVAGAVHGERAASGAAGAPMVAEAPGTAPDTAYVRAPVDDAEDPAASVPFSAAAERMRVESAHQVRIEQRMIIRIMPRPSRRPSELLFAMPNRDTAPHIIERRIGKCLVASGIAGVKSNGGNEIVLFMRDRMVVSAMLERACRARDFYSGFYLAPNADGKLCVERDTLLSRSGANCKLTRIRQLVQVGE